MPRTINLALIIAMAVASVRPLMASQLLAYGSSDLHKQESARLGPPGHIVIAKIEDSELSDAQLADDQQQWGSIDCEIVDQPCTWENTYGGPLEDKLYDLVAMPDGGAVLVGHSRSFGGGDYDGLVVRLNRGGEVLWRQRLGGRAVDHAYGVTLDSKMGIVIAGHTRSFGRGGADIWVVRLDIHGNLLWERTFGGENEDRARSITATVDGGSLVAGFTMATAAEEPDAVLIRLNSRGELVWQKKVGSAGHDGLFDVTLLTDGSIGAVGYTQRSASPGYDFWVLRFASGGNLLWQKQLRKGRLDAATAVIPTPEGGLLAVGVTSADSFGQDDAWILHFDNQGQLIWERIIGGEGQQKAWAAARHDFRTMVVAIATTSTGEGSTDAQLIGIDNTGRVLWSRVYGHKLWDRPTSLAIGSAGEIILGGYTTSSGAGYEDFWVLRLNAEGGL